MLTVEQYETLMRPLNASRISKKQGMSYLEAWDVRAHLIRVFGFGGFSITADEAECVSVREIPQKEGGKMNHEVCWKVRVSLVIPALGAVYTEYAIGSSSQPSLPEAHDMAIKTAESDAMKRAAINLGNQFGLSLYDDGSTKDIIMKTLVAPDGAATHTVSAEETQAALNTAPEEMIAEAVELLGGATHSVSEPGSDFLDALRPLRDESDNQKRILAVAGLKEQAKGTGVLDEITVVNGNPITLARLADMVAQGTWVKTVEEA